MVVEVRRSMAVGLAFALAASACRGSDPVAPRGVLADSQTVVAVPGVQTTVTVCSRGAGASFSLTGATWASLTLIAEHCRAVASHSSGMPTVTVQAAEAAPAGTILDSIVISAGTGHTRLLGVAVATAMATETGSAIITFYNHIATRTTVTLCSVGAGATFRITGAATLTPFVAAGQCPAVASHPFGVTPTTVQVLELVPNGAVLDSIVSVSATGRARLTGVTTASASAVDGGGATLTFYNRLVPPTTVTVCSAGRGATFGLSGATSTTLSLAAGQCVVVQTHVGGTPQLGVRATENVVAGLVLDSIVTIGGAGHARIVGQRAVTVIADDVSGSKATFYNH